MGKADADLNSGGKTPVWSCAAFFLILVICVHLIPYIPSNSFYFCRSPPENSNAEPEFPPLHRDTCLSFLHSIDYKGSVKCENEPCKKNTWDWNIHSGRISECGFRRLNRFDASALVNGSWILVAGDSQMRMLYFSLLGILVAPEQVEATKQNFHKHRNYTTTVDDMGLKMDFVWAPYVLNLTRIVSELKKEAKRPNLILMGGGAWDALHVGDVSDYRYGMEAFKSASETLFGDGDGDLRGAFWVPIPNMINWKMTAVKREKLSKEICRAYDDVLKESKICRESGGAMFTVDLRVLSDLCGEKCSLDGLHFDVVVYESACQVMFNALNIQFSPNLVQF